MKKLLKKLILTILILLIPAIALGWGVITLSGGGGGEPTFKFDVVTTASPETFALPLEATGTYDFHVDWGDGNSDDITVWNHADVTHTYASAGTHTIKITGTITGWTFAGGGDKAKIYEIKSWGPLKLGNSGQYFYGCTNLTVTATDALDLTGTASFYRAFRDCTSLTTIDTSLWDVSGVVSFDDAFRDCSALVSLNTSSWNTGSMTSAGSMFYGCTSLTTLDVSGWDVSGMTSMHTFFNGCSSLLALDVSSWDVSNVTRFDNTFNTCSSLTTLAVGSWDVSSATRLDGTFALCSSLTTLDVSSWNVSSVSNFLGTFQNCSSLLALDVSSWDVTGTTILSGTFSGMTSITTFDVSLWNVSGITSFYQTFTSCSSLTTLDVSSWDVSAVTSFYRTFSACTSLVTLDVSLWNVASVTNFYETFNYCTSLTILDVSGWNTGSATTFERMFRLDYVLTTLAANNWNVTGVTNMTWMFYGTTLTTVSYDAILVGWEAQAVQNNVPFHGGNSQYSAGIPATAKAALINDHTWVITDGGQEIFCDLEAHFTADNQTFSNAQVLDTAAEGVTTGSLTVVDTGAGTVKIVSNELELIGINSYDDAGVYETSGIAKVLGKAFLSKVIWDTDSSIIVGWNEATGIATSTSVGISFEMDSDISLPKLDSLSAVAEVAKDVLVNGTTYQLLILAGGYDTNSIAFKTGDTATSFKYGWHYFIKGGVFTNWTKLGTTCINNDTPMYPYAQTFHTVAITSDTWLVPLSALDIDIMFQPNFLDTFTGTNDDQLISAHTPEVVDGATGTGNPWESGSTTWTIQTNKASNNPTQGAELAAGNLTAGIWYVITATEANTFFTGCAVGDYFKALAATGLDANNKVRALVTNEIHASDDLSVAQGIFNVNLTVAANNPQAGLLIASDSESNPQNYIEIYYDQVDAHVRLVKVVAGLPTELIDDAEAYSAGAQLKAIVDYVSGTDDLKIKVYYNGNLMGTEKTVTDNGIAGNTRHGIMSVDSTNSLDNFTVHNRTDANWDTEISAATKDIY